MATKVITSQVVEAASAAGQQRIDLPPGVVVTPAARERARDLGIALGNEPVVDGPTTSWRRSSPVSGSAQGAGPTLIASRRQQSTTTIVTPGAPVPSAPSGQPAVPAGGNGRRPEGWSAPFLSSPYTPPPHPMERARMIIVEFQADEQAMRDAVPAPLELVPGSTAVAFIGENRQMPTALNFHEGSVVLKVRLGNLAGNFTPYIWTSTDEPMLAGREVSGRPKLLCEPTPMAEEGNFVSTRIVRRGQTLMSIGVTIERHGDPKNLPLRGGWLSVRKIVMPERGRPSLKQVIYHELSHSLQVNWIWEGRGQFDLPETALSAVSELRPKGVLRAWYAELGWFLDWGKIVWEDWVPQEEGDPYYESMLNGGVRATVVAPTAPVVAAPAMPRLSAAPAYPVQAPEAPGVTPPVTVPGAPVWKGRPYIKALDTAALPWKRTGTGLYQKILSRDPETQARTALAWVIPDEGYSPPKTAHYHNTYEEILVVHGCLSFNSRDWLPRGAYCWHPTRTTHGFKSAVREPTIFLSRVGRDLDFNLIENPPQQDPYNLDGPIERMSRAPVYVLGLAPEGWEDVRDASGKVVLRRKVLSSDKNTGEGSMLVRFMPGWVSQRDRHYHTVYEEAFILEGEIKYDDGTTYLPGFYMFRPPFTIHGKASSEKGALAYINFGGKLDFLPA